MLAVPDLDGPSVVFGNIKHMPKYETLPDEFQRDWSSDCNVFCKAVATWFYTGATISDGKLTVGDKTFKPKPGVDPNKALRAIKSILGSFEPKHEHKIAGCGYMLSEWFEVAE